MSCTITGNLKTLLGVAVVTNCFVRFNLRGCNGAQARVSGTALIPPAKGTNWYVDIAPDASGAISGSTYSNDVDIDTTLTPGQHPTWYGVVIYQNGIQGPETPYNLADGTTFNLNSATPITTIPVVTAPTGDTTYARLDGGNMPFTGQIVGKAGTVSSPSIVLNGSLTTGFWRQAADVFGFSVATVLKWLANATGFLFGSGQAIGFSSNADPSLAAGDSWLSRIGAGIVGIGTAAGNALGTIRAAILQIGGSDTRLTRTAAGVAALGDGTQGNITGNLKLGTITLYKSDGTVPATWTNDTAGGINFTSNSGKFIEFNTQGQIVLFGATSGTTILAPTGVASGTVTFPAETGTLGIKPTITLKKGTGAGNYNGTNTSFADVDATNLSYTVTIPNGWKLIVQVSAAIFNSTATANVALAIFDSSVLVENQISGVLNVTATSTLSWVINGDGASHTVKLQAKTTAGADAWNVFNDTATRVPTMVFILTPSN